MSTIEERLTRLSPQEQRAYLAELLRRRMTEPKRVPVSFTQQRFWLLDQLAPGSAYYNVSAAAHLVGTLDVALLRESVRMVVKRHETLRTTFVQHDGQVMQQIAPELDLPLAVVDLESLPTSERMAEALRQSNAAAAQPFDLAQGPLLRLVLYRLADNEHVLLVLIHHIVTDGWSMDVFLRELAACYHALQHNQTQMIAPLPTQYSNFAAQQRQQLQGAKLEQLLAFWEQYLAAAPASLDLPIDFARPPKPSLQGARHPIQLSSELTLALQTLSQREGVTVFMVLLSTLLVLLQRYSGQDDLVVGTPVAGRVRTELESLIGCFVNTLALRTDLKDASSFREVLSRVKVSTIDAFSHQELPFELLNDTLQQTRDSRRSSLLQVLFAYQTTPFTTLEAEGLTLTPLPISNNTSKFDLEIDLWNGPDGLFGYIEYATDLFAPATITRLADHFCTLLAGVVAAPEAHPEHLPLLTDAEREQIVSAWNVDHAPLAQDVYVHDLVAAQAARTPDATAAVFNDRRLSYRELNQRANQLAHALRRRNVGPDQLVGVCLPRSLELLVAVLGVLKAGAAYVPLDPAYPTERLRAMLTQSCLGLILTEQALLERLPEDVPGYICLDRDAPVIAQERESDLSLPTHADQLAYVLFTSGSTGTPKGVAMGHSALANLIGWHLRDPALGQPARTLHFAPISFDVSFQELFSCWCSGGTLLVIDDELRRDPSRLLRFLDQAAVERLFVPFVALQQLAEVAATTDQLPQRLREIITAGEQLQISPALASWLRRQPGCTLYNHYGPTEGHVVTSYTLAGDPAAWPALPPIGRPVANTQVYILDRQLQPVPIGVAGELYFGGVQLARGYLRRPGLTAEKFVPDPFSGRPGARLYRTGDLARYRDDGHLLFLGRRDQQVKLRGFRIELGEIENVLRQHPAIVDAAVLAREDVPGSQRLVAYVVMEEPRIERQEPDSQFAQRAPVLGSPADLRQFVKARLPEYMVPGAFVMLDALPLTPNGKLDRHKLPQPDKEHIAQRGPTIEPRTEREALIAEIWRDVLQVETVGVFDDFFDLGGHSLLGTQISSRLSAALGRAVPLSLLFEAPTIAALAVQLDQQDELATSSSVSAVSLPTISLAEHAALMRHERHAVPEADQVLTVGREEGEL